LPGAAFLGSWSIRKSLGSFPSFIALVSHLGFIPRPAHVSPFGPRYFGAAFLLVALFGFFPL
jgi:hypothetical protein